MSAPWGRRFETAVVISPPEELWAPIQAIRKDHDRAYERWMPHVNLVFPFVELAHFGSAASALRGALADVAPFEVTLDVFSYFAQSKGKFTVHLQPRTASAPCGLQRVHAAVTRALPDHRDQIRDGAFHPHLTVGQVHGRPALDAFLERVRAAWQPIVFTVRDVQLIHRDGKDTPFRVVERVPLGAGGVPSALPMPEGGAAVAPAPLSVQQAQLDALMMPLSPTTTAVVAQAPAPVEPAVAAPAVAAPAAVEPAVAAPAAVVPAAVEPAVAAVSESQRAAQSWEVVPVDERVRVSLFPNGSRKGGKVLIMPDEWDVFLERCSIKMGMTVTRAFTGDGAEADDVDDILPNDILFVSGGADFLPPDAATAAATAAPLATAAAAAAAACALPPAPAAAPSAVAAPARAPAPQRAHVSVSVAGDEGTGTGTGTDKGKGKGKGVDKDGADGWGHSHMFDSWVKEVRSIKVKSRHTIADKKLMLVNLACGHVTRKEPEFRNQEDLGRKTIIKQAVKVVVEDAEFLLKLALYIRRELHIRTTANFLLSLAAHIKPCQQYLPLYFPNIVVLPQDLVEVATLYHTIPNRHLKARSFPRSFRRVLSERFATLEEYKFAKINPSAANHRKRFKAALKRWEQGCVWRKRRGQPLRAKPVQGLPPVTLQSLVRTLHLSEPRARVLKVLGHKYPASEEAFAKSGLPGAWDPERAGTRMRFEDKSGKSWQKKVSAAVSSVSSQGTRAKAQAKARAWTELAESGKLTYMSALRNLRNMLLAAMPEAAHAKVLALLSNKDAVARSKQSPFAFLKAFNALEMVNVQVRMLLGHKQITGRQRRELMASYGLTSALVNKLPDAHVFERYQDALDVAMKLSVVHNVQPIKGRTIVLVDVGKHMRTLNEDTSSKSLLSQHAKVALMLGMLCKFRCVNQCELYMFGCASTTDAYSAAVRKVRYGRNVNLCRWIEQVFTNDAAQLRYGNAFPFDFFNDLIDRKESVENVVVLSGNWLEHDNVIRDTATWSRSVDEIVERYKRLVNKALNLVAIDVKGSGATPMDNSLNYTLLSGFTDKILNFIAERGLGQLHAVETIDTRLGLHKKARRALEKLNRKRGGVEVAAVVVADEELCDPDSEIPFDFLCPITQELMVDPVVAVDGHSYERAAIEHWLEISDLSPMTGLELDATLVFPNASLRSTIDKWKQENPHLVPVD